MKATKNRRTLLGTVAVIAVAVVVVPLVSLVVIVRLMAGAVTPAATAEPTAKPTAQAAPWIVPAPTGAGTTRAGTGLPTFPLTPEPTMTPDPVETKPGPAKCAQAAAALAKAITPGKSAPAWRERMAPLVTGEIEDVLPTVDVTAIPAGTPKVGEVIEQPGACDATLVWADTAWRVAFVNQGSGWVASEWDAA